MDYSEGGVEKKLYIHHALDKIINKSAGKLMFNQTRQYHNYDQEASYKQDRPVVKSSLQVLKNYSVEKIEFTHYDRGSFKTIRKLLLSRDLINYTLDSNYSCAIMKTLATGITVQGLYLVQIKGALKDMDVELIEDGEECGSSDNLKPIYSEEEVLFTHKVRLSSCQTIKGEADRGKCF